MKIEMNKNGTELEVILGGRLDIATSPELEKQLDGGLEGITSLIFELKELEYVTSAGLRVLLNAQEVMDEQGQMIVRHPNEVVYEVLELTGFLDFMTIEE